MKKQGHSCPRLLALVSRLSFDVLFDPLAPLLISACLFNREDRGGGSLATNGAVACALVLFPLPRSQKRESERMGVKRWGWMGEEGGGCGL